MAEPKNKKKIKPALVLPITVTQIQIQGIFHDDQAYMNVDDFLRCYSGLLAMSGSPFQSMNQILDAVQSMRKSIKESKQ